MAAILYPIVMILILPWEKRRLSTERAILSLDKSSDNSWEIADLGAMLSVLKSGISLRAGSRGAAQRLRRLAEGADKGAAHPLGVAKAC